MSFILPVRVYIEDTDMGGIVYYVNYLKYMERARTEFLRSFAVEQNELQNQGYLFVVKSVQCDYKLPAKLDQQLAISVRVQKCGAASVLFKQQICHENVVLCEALIEVVCVEGVTMKPVRLPVAIKNVLVETHKSG